MCLNLTASGVIDGCGADASWQNGVDQMATWEISSATATAWEAGHKAMMLQTTEALNKGILMGKDPWELAEGYVNGALHEGCDADEATILTLQNLTKISKQSSPPKRMVYECHGRGDLDELAAFLKSAKNAIKSVGEVSGAWSQELSAAVGHGAEWVGPPVTGVWSGAVGDEVRGVAGPWPAGTVVSHGRYSSDRFLPSGERVGWKFYYPKLVAALRESMAAPAATSTAPATEGDAAVSTAATTAAAGDDGAGSRGDDEHGEVM